MRKDGRVTNAPRLELCELSVSGSTALLTLGGDKVHSLGKDLLDEIVTSVGFCEQDPGVGALVLTGGGEIFSAGLNVNEVLADSADSVLDAFETALMAVLECPLPTVAAVNGAAIAGGCLLACACDRRIVADEARIGVTELRVGVAFPVFTIELLRHVCGARAEDVVFGADLIGAEEACAVGLAHQHVPRAQLEAAATAAAEQLSALDARAYALAKASLRREMLSSARDEGGRSLDHQVRDHWQDEATRANLERLVAPKR
jgi:enoyl-CoA hydratase/carnithine racemase